MKHQVRVCTSEDLDSMLHLARAMHQESPVYKVLPLDSVKLLNLAETAISFPDLATILITTDDDGLITGMLGAISTTEFFGPSVSTCDLFLYVKKEYRGSRAAIKLVRAYQKWAESLGATRIHLGVTTGMLIKETGGLYEALGFKQSGILYTRNNPHGTSQTQSSSS
jgi:GNAT superfamily N-acetyltransferase